MNIKSKAPVATSWIDATIKASVEPDATFLAEWLENIKKQTKDHTGPYEIAKYFVGKIELPRMPQ